MAPKLDGIAVKPGMIRRKRDLGKQSKMEISNCPCSILLSSGCRYRITNLTTLKFGSRKTAVVLYFGELDPSGTDISRHVENAIRFFEVDLTFERVGLFLEHVRKHDLPQWKEKKKSKN